VVVVEVRLSREQSYSCSPPLWRRQSVTARWTPVSHRPYWTLPCGEHDPPETGHVLVPGWHKTVGSFAAAWRQI